MKIRKRIIRVPVRDRNYLCKKCGDILHKDDLTKHHYVCYQENVSPEEIRDCFLGV